MDHALFSGIVVVTLALFFAFSNGFNDAANQVATVISSRVLTPESALLLAAAANFLGAAFLGTRVAKTIGKNIVDFDLVPDPRLALYVLASALLGALVWNVTTWYFGIPSSSSHSLLGGLGGAFLASLGHQALQWKNIVTILIVMVVTPVVGFIATYAITKLTYFIGEWLSPRAHFVFKRMQMVSLFIQGLAHGTNDGQKTMGVIVLALILLNLHPARPDAEFSIPPWVIYSSSSAMALGMLLGGWRIIRKLGAGLYRVRPIHSFSAHIASGAVLYGASLFGFPVSTTQVISSSVLGAGAAFRPKAVRWQVAFEMITAWLITIPVTAAIAAVFFKLIHAVMY